MRTGSFCWAKTRGATKPADVAAAPANAARRETRIFMTPPQSRAGVPVTRTIWRYPWKIVEKLICAGAAFCVAYRELRGGSLLSGQCLDRCIRLALANQAAEVLRTQLEQECQARIGAEQSRPAAPMPAASATADVSASSRYHSSSRGYYSG